MYELEPVVERVELRLPPPDGRGCRVWPGAKARGGYGSVGAVLGDRKTLRVARLLVAARDGLDLDDMSWCARHTCDNPPCCAVDHLVSGTRKQNSGDMVARGRTGQGRWKLTDEQRAEIRRQRADGVPRKLVAERYGVHPEHVTAICRGRSWRAHR